jgi:hypothetical protein
MSRATMSLALPAVNGLTTSTGRVGHSICAVAGRLEPIATKVAIAAKSMLNRNFIMP